jgi:diguanylate cyclase (GGDEF)-like protein
LSFRGRLTLFFLLIVVLPMIAVAVLVTQVTTQSSHGKADARLAAGLESALAVYRDDVAQARKGAKDVARASSLSTALHSGQRTTVEAVADRLARENGLRSLIIRDARGNRLAAAGPPTQIAAARLNLRGPGGTLGSLTASMTTASSYVDRVRHLTGRDVALLGEGGSISSTLRLGGVSLPSSGSSTSVELGGDTLRAATGDLPGPGALRIAMFGPVGSGGFFSSSPLVAAVLVLFFAVAIVFVTMLLRALGGQVSAMLDVARRIGGGDFSRKVPVVGGDEMAGLASEFNKMSDRLAAQMEELRRQQVEIDRSVRRIGEAFASGLDRQTLLGIVAETSLGACAAQYGRIALRDRQATDAEVGRSATGKLREAVGAAEQRAGRDGSLAGARREEAHALASPIRRIGEETSVGTMTIAREGEAFTAAERDVFLYLVGQVSASIANIALHELVSEQAVTDELTGLSNNRRFRELIAKEASRASRFGHELSLVMLDIDDFKQVNDTYGHLQGDAVLRSVAGVLDEESRGVDEPARYGGEEFAVALPETGLDGALELAERVRARIEAKRVPMVDGEGALSVTASLGAATMPGSATDAETLIAAADAALYEAKRAGKNRVSGAAETRAAGHP